MRYKDVLLLVLEGIVIPGAASPATAGMQNPAHTAGGASHADIERAVNAAKDAFEEALVKHDRVALDKVLADSFVRVADDGRVDSREAFLDKTARGFAIPGLPREGLDIRFFDVTVMVNGSTAIRMARSRTRFAPGQGPFGPGVQELWARQTHVFTSDGTAWKVALVTGSTVYAGPVTTAAMYQAYAGTYKDQANNDLLRLDWDGDALLASYPTGERGQIFLKSATEEAVLHGQSQFRFELDESGRPVAVVLFKAGKQTWRATRVK